MLLARMTGFDVRVCDDGILQRIMASNEAVNQPALSRRFKELALIKLCFCLEFQVKEISFFLHKSAGLGLTSGR